MCSKRNTEPPVKRNEKQVKTLWSVKLFLIKAEHILLVEINSEVTVKPMTTQIFKSHLTGFNVPNTGCFFKGPLSQKYLPLTISSSISLSFNISKL